MKSTSNPFLRMPQTRLGWWAAGLAAAGILLVFAWSILPGGAWLGLLCELAGGILALTAIVRERERSWLVWLSILPMVNVFIFILAEFLFPH